MYYCMVAYLLNVFMFIIVYGLIIKELTLIRFSSFLELDLISNLSRHSNIFSSKFYFQNIFNSI